MRKFTAPLHKSKPLKTLFSHSFLVKN